jgi:hypothetical protein
MSSAIATTVLLEKKPTIRARFVADIAERVRHHGRYEHESSPPEESSLVSNLDLDLSLIDKQDLLRHVDVTRAALARIEFHAQHGSARVPGRPEHRECEVRLYVGICLDGACVELELVQVRADHR